MCLHHKQSRRNYAFKISLTSKFCSLLDVAVIWPTATFIIAAPTEPDQSYSTHQLSLTQHKYALHCCCVPAVLLLAVEYRRCK